MRRILLLALAVLSVGLVGCGGQEERGKYRNRERPIQTGQNPL